MVGPGPFLNEVGESEVRACGDSGLAERQPDRFGCQRVVCGKRLCHLHSSVAQVADADVRSRRLLKHESAEILQLGTQRRVRAVVDEEPEFKAGSIILNWRPVGNAHSLVLEINQDIIWSEVGRSSVLFPFDGHNDPYQRT